MRTTPLLPSPPGFLLPRVETPDKGRFYGSNRTVWHQNCVQTNELCSIDSFEIELFDHRRSPEHQEHLPAIMTTSFFFFFSVHPWDKLHANLPHLEFLANNCVHSSHTDIKLCTYCLYRHTTVLIHEILYLAHQLWRSDFLTPATPLIIPHRLPAFLESLMPLKNWCSVHARWSKISLKHAIRLHPVNVLSLWSKKL